MENVTYLSSGALNRAHFALVTRQEQGGRNEDEAVWETFSTIKTRMTRPSGAGIAASIGSFFNAAGLHLQLPASGWNSKQTREDLLLLLYCRQSLEGGSRTLSVKELMFALPAALTLAEAGQTIGERRVGYSFCADVLPSDHEMQLLIVNTIRKDMESSNPARIILALDAIIASPNMDVIPAVKDRLEVLSAHKSLHVRRRVLHALRILGALDPEILHDCKESLVLRLRDDNPVVKSAALTLLQTCLQTNTFDQDFVMDTLIELIRPSKGKKHSSRLYSPGFMTVCVMEILGSMVPGNTEDALKLFDTILIVASKAAAHHSWNVLLACMRTVSRFPAALVTTKLMQTFRTSEASLHPLSFLSPLLRSTDVNVISVLLQALVSLPVQTWAGGLVTNGSDEDPHKTGQKESLMVEKQSSILTPSPVGEIAEAELFGDEVEQEVWQTPAQTDVPLNEEMILPALFSETEVGIIVGLLRSRDENIRKMTLSLLASSDPSPDGVVNQYLNQLLTAASLSRSPETETAEEMIRRTSLVCQALQVAEVLSGNNGTTYATSVADIILRTDNQQTHKVALGSPTLSNRSRTSADTKSSGKGRGGTMEKAIEMVLTRARKTPTFFSQFSGQIIQTILNQRVDDRISITFLVISAAVVCEEEEITRDEAGQLLYRFNGYLLLTTASIQETLFLVMLRLLACLESAPEAVVNTINELKYRSGRHIQQRCFQFLDRLKNIPVLRKAVHDTKPLNIASLLRILETTEPPSRDLSPEAKQSSTSNQESILGLSTFNAPNKSLRYQAYDPPTRANRGASRTQNMQADIRKGRASNFAQSSPVEREDASDLIELASTINLSKDRTKGRTITPLSEDGYGEALESPFETSISAVLSDIKPPPFLSRTRSPHTSPPLTPGRFQRSPPLSPRTSTPLRDSPSLRPGKLDSVSQDTEVMFDIRFDRLGAQPKSTARGWFEGGMNGVIEKLKALSLIETTIVYQNGDDSKVQLTQGSQLGLLKLRQEEDNSTLWILRCGDISLQRKIKEALI